MKSKRIPKKLKNDSILEALCELQFESGEIPETIIGKLLNNGRLIGFQSSRLPASDIPAPIRDANPNLKFAPIIESKKDNELVRVGGNVLSRHVIGPYCGWEKFRPKLIELASILFDAALADLKITKIGLRYLNALTPTKHFIASISNLDLKVMVDGEALTNAINLNFSKPCDTTHLAMVRIATSNFTAGAFPPDMTAFIDIDVSSPKNLGFRNIDDVITWIDKAHEYEKKSFFGLLPAELIDKLEDRPQ